MTVRQPAGRSLGDDQRVKILHIIATANPASGGPIEGILRQDEATRDIAVRDLVTLDPPGASFLRNLGVKAYGLGDEHRTWWRTGPLNHYGYTSRLIPWLKANAGNYDVVIVNGLWNYATFAAAVTLPGGTTPYFVFTHGMMDPWFKRTYPLKHVAKLGFWLFCEGRLLAGARAVLFTTDEERRLASGQFPTWRYNEKVVGYGTGAPPSEAPNQAEAFERITPRLGARPYLLFLSRVHRKKGCDLLVEAFAKVTKAHPELDLVVAGPDQEGWLDALQAKAKALGVDHRIHWPGMLRGDAKWGAYRGAQAFILPSHQENFGIVVAEALSCGTPVLITDKVNIWREVEAGGAGLVADDTQQGVDSLIARWIRMPETDRGEMRASALRTFRQHFDVRTVAPEFIKNINHMRQSDTKTE